MVLSEMHPITTAANGNARWSSADYERLVELYRAGEPIRTIAKLMGRAQENRSPKQPRLQNGMKED